MLGWQLWGGNGIESPEGLREKKLIPQTYSLTIETHCDNIRFIIIKDTERITM